MKRIFAFCLALIILLSVMVSCVNTNDSTTTTTTSSSTATTRPAGTTTNNGGSGSSSNTDPGTNPDPTPDDDPYAEPNQPDTPVITGSVDVTFTGYSFETIYCEWKPFANADGYNVYCDGKKIDKELIRNYGSYFRCDKA